MNSQVKYRPEIDGLRAIAVLAVIIYHAKITHHGKNILSGGFLGVDIFFVISGFLITSILIREIAENRFSLLAFYERRARRILPVLFFVMACSWPFALYYMLPRPLIEYANSIVTSIFFVSNIFFWTQDSYTAEPSVFKPFLHTWSLSVEEQYYIFFPLLLILIFRFAKYSLKAFIVAGLIASLALAEWIGIKYPDASFFLFPMRAWELFAGALIASNFQEKERALKSYSNILPLIGLFLIAISLFFFEDKMEHLSLFTAVPVLGTVLFIHYSNRGNLAGKMLSARFFVGIGLISYSLYLWHQPFFVFSKIANLDSDVAKALTITFTFALAFLSWKFIEQPFRNRAIVSQKILCAVLGVSALALLVLSGLAFQTSGFPSRFSPVIIEATGGEDPLDILKDKNGICHNRKITDKSGDSEICVLGNVDSRLNFIALGDSHIASFSSILWDRIKNLGGSYTGLTFSGHYAPGLEISNNGTTETNSYEREIWTGNYMRKVKPSIVIVGGRLPLYYSGDWYDNGEGGKEEQHRYYMQSKGGDANEKIRRRAVAANIKNSILELLKNGHKVVLIYPVPEAGWNVPRHLMENYRKGIDNVNDQDHWLSTSYKRFHDRTKDAYEIYDSVGKNKNLIRIYPEKIFCNTILKDRCINNTSEHIYYVDSNHLSLAGSTLLVDKIMLETKKAGWLEKRP